MTRDELIAENERLTSEVATLRSAIRVVHDTRAHATPADGENERSLVLAAMGAQLLGGKELARDLVHSSSRPHLFSGIVLDEYHRLFTDWCRAKGEEPLEVWRRARLAERSDESR
ncbi:MAG: hypothetical protein ACT4PW_05770 [Acidimicrobiia bacterium]